MKPTVATSLSLVAVLGAGALAAVANLRVFAGPDHAASAIGAAQSSSVEVGDAPTTGSGTAAGPQTFTLGPAGSLTLDATGGLHVVRVDPSPGWRAERLPAAADAVLVGFQSPDGHGIVVTAVPGPDGIRVLAHDDVASLARPAGDDDTDADDD
jgi:hypothetical protein